MFLLFACIFVLGVAVGYIIPKKHYEKTMSYYVAFSDKFIKKIFYN